MQAIETAFRTALEPLRLPYSHFKTHNIVYPSVCLHGSSDTGQRFVFRIIPENRTTYIPGGRVTVTLASKGNFREYTGTPEKCIARVKDWLDKRGL